MVRGLLLVAALSWSAPAEAKPSEGPIAFPVEGPQTPYPVIEEHELHPLEPGLPAPQVDEQVHPFPGWSWPREHLGQGRNFADPFLGPEVYPEVSAGLEVTATHLRSNRSILFDQEVALGLYLIDIKFPLIAYDDGTIPPSRVLVDFKIPISLAERHRLTVVWGASIPNSGPALSGSSRAELLYAFGGYGLTLQLKLGYGFEQLFIDQPRREASLYGGLLGLRIGRFQPVVQVDGAQFMASRANRLALVSGAWFFPFDQDTVQLGASALVVLSSDCPGNRFGAIASMSYNFL